MENVRGKKNPRVYALRPSQWSFWLNGACWAHATIVDTPGKILSHSQQDPHAHKDVTGEDQRNYSQDSIHTGVKLEAESLTCVLRVLSVFCQ